MNHNKVCKTCGKHFFSKYVQKIYCSDFCAPSPVPFEKKPKIEKKCCVCSGTFLDWAKGQKKYCSEVCYENNSRSSFNLRVRFTVFKKHNFTCQYCGRKAPEVVLEVDHVYPKSKGGPDSIENYTTACRDCNIGKSNLIL